MDSRTSRYQRSAEAFLVGASAADRREIERIVRNLCVDPFVNNKTVFWLPYPPAILNVYRDSRYWIAFHLPENGRLSVLNIGHASSPPAL